MKRSLGFLAGFIAGGFLAAIIGVAEGDTAALRPEQFIARPWTWTAIQSFADGMLKLNGVTSGATIVKAPATGGGTVTLPTGTGTLAFGGSGADPTLPNSWTALQTYNNSTIKMLGSSSGGTTLTSANAGASNFTLTLPAANTTIPIATQALSFTGPTAARTITLPDANTTVPTATQPLTYAGPTAARTITYPDASFTAAALNVAGQNVAGGANVTALTQASGNITIDCGARPLQFMSNVGAFTITAPASDGSCIMLVTNGVGAGAITFTGFSVGTSVGDALTTTNGSKFSISIWRINGTASYRVAAHQ
jgi:hypothetical protein